MKFVFNFCRLEFSTSRFEQSHPFSDGNGRIGRLLIQAMALINLVNLVPGLNLVPGKNLVPGRIGRDSGTEPGTGTVEPLPLAS